MMLALTGNAQAAPAARIFDSISSHISRTVLPTQSVLRASSRTAEAILPALTYASLSNAGAAGASNLSMDALKEGAAGPARGLWSSLA